MIAQKILILNGPNLNLLGNRETDVYGAKSFEDFFVSLKQEYNNVSIDYIQSNREGELIDALQNSNNEYKGIVLNAGGYTHTSVSIRDAIKASTVPVIEVHISNISNRESFRHTSLITPVCSGSIMGFGLNGYKIAVNALLLK